MPDRPHYNSLQAALEKTDAEMTTAEVHGVLCGMYCAAGQAELGKWLEQIFEAFDVNDMLVKEASQLLVGLHRSTQEQLNDAEAGFELLLPDDEVRLAERSEALASWCQGFTFGLVAGGLKEGADLPHDSRELIRDLVEIARLGHEEPEGDEADEEAYMQLSEYVRMAVLLINEELQPLKPAAETRH